MSDRVEKAQAVDTILYTSEAAASRQQAAEDLKVDDPSPEQAIAVLTGRGGMTPPPAPANEEPQGEPAND